MCLLFQNIVLYIKYFIQNTKKNWEVYSSILQFNGIRNF